MRVAVITPIPTPYRDPLWNVVAEKLDGKLDVYYCAPQRADRPWEVNWDRKYNAIHLRAINFARAFGQDAGCYWNHGIISRLKKGRYDAFVIGGYNHITMLAAVLYAKLSGIPYFLMSEVYLAQPRKTWRRYLKEPLVRWLVSNGAGFFPTGTLASEYLIHYGAKPNQLSPIPNAPDVDHFLASAKRNRERRQNLLSELKIDGTKKNILFVSRLIKLKRVDVLLRAFADVIKKNDAQLIILGDGTMRTRWESLSKELGLDNHVDFRGFIAPEELPQWYAVADLLVLPSEDETWSVVVLEALASGVPVVITEMVGCHRDVINDPRVGSVVPVNDPHKLSLAIEEKLEEMTDPEEIFRLWQPIRDSVRYAKLARCLIHFIRENAKLVHDGRKETPVVPKSQ